MWDSPFVEYEDPEAAELRAQDRAERRYQRQLVAHPNPGDPDYPGDTREGEE